MAVHAPGFKQKPRKAPDLEVAVLPAPISGIDGRLNLASNTVENAVYAYNLVPSEYGLRSRFGYREWATNIETAPSAGSGVRSLVPYTGTSGVFSDKLFAVTNEGIWDVSDATDTPVLELAFGDTTGDAGWGNYAHYTTAAGTETVFYADEVNGLQQYTPSTDTWAAAAGITGVDVADVVFVVVHKQRIWLVERSTPAAWYLPIASVSGAATKFSFGSKFRHGGDLVGLYNWSIDGGDGVDDYLVAVGRGGDILPYRGEDPSAVATWTGVGTFFVGQLPVGRRCATEDGGDLRLLCEAGLVTLSDLLRGTALTPESEQVDLKIARFIREDMKTYSQERGWEIRLNPGEGSILVGSPVRSNGVYLQYTYNRAVRGWGQWRGVPAQVFEPWAGAMMAGTPDGRVVRMDVTTDNVLYDGTPGTAVAFSFLQNYGDGGAPGRFKFPKFMRPNFLGLQPVTVTTRYLYDYDINTLLRAPIAPDTETTDVWDTALWDDGIWQSSDVTSQTVTRGAWGQGRAVAIAVRGECRTRTTLVSTDIMWSVGGPF